MAFKRGALTKRQRREADVRNSEIVKLREQGWPLQAIARRYRVSKQRVHQILSQG